MRSPLGIPVATLAFLLASGCMNVSPAGASFSSEPPGARVHVDGRDTGWVTPCEIAIDVEHAHTVALSMDGYETRELTLVPDERRSMVEWRSGVNGSKTVIRIPILLAVPDLFFPIRESEALSPGRIFVRLRPVAVP